MSKTRCITPITIKNKRTSLTQEVPCSRCWPCIKRRADGWAARILWEKKRSTSAAFVTLTYSDNHVPIDPTTMNLTLDRKAIPLYMKRLRKLHDKVKSLDTSNKLEHKPLKYYAVGEYGEENERPHYHIILFNAIKELIPLAWAIDNKMLGMVDIGKKGVTAGGARYLAEYMMTGQKEPYRVETDGTKTYFRERPFSLMSKNLGDNYLTKKMKEWHLVPSGTIKNKNGKNINIRDRYYMVIEGGKKIALPRYYRDRIFPKMYREIDVPIITNKFQDKEYKEKIEPDPIGYIINMEGQKMTNQSILEKKIKTKQRNAMAREL